MATAMAIISGASATRQTSATRRSKAALMARIGPVNSGCSTWSSGSPATGRTCTRGPATSISPGATTRSTPAPSSSQPSRLSTLLLMPREEVTATVSAPVAATACGTVVSVPTVGTSSPSRIRMRSPPGTQAPTTSRPAYGERRSWTTRSRTSSGAPTDEDPVGPAAAAGPGPVQQLAGDPPPEQQRRGAYGEGHGEEATGQLDVSKEADDRDEAPVAQAGVGEALVLLHTNPEDLAVVDTGHA